MDVLHPKCCGLDVHKNSISACILVQVAGRVQKHQRRFGAMTQDLQELANWLRQFEVAQVAMESSGVYWKPVWNILEGQFTVVLANAQHIKNVPGRKTDQKDAEWIAQLLQHGLLRPSYVPCEVIRDLRDLTRMRASLSQEASRISSRVQKVLEDANVKLASVATNTLGKSGRAMLEEIIAGQNDPEYLASLAFENIRCAGTRNCVRGFGLRVTLRHSGIESVSQRPRTRNLHDRPPECPLHTRPSNSNYRSVAGTL